jgi:transcription antitermination protein NusB
MSQVFRRRYVREKVLQILYAQEMNKDALQALLDGMLSDVNDSAERDFADNLVNRVIIHKKNLDEIIKKRVDNWEMNRIALIDKILLRMGICEILYFPDIPPKVSINESIEIAKIYSTAGSGKFINGILDAVLNELKIKGEVKKTGRGLVDESTSKQNTKKKSE